MRVRRSAWVMTVAVSLVATAASAAQYPARSDTGWVHVHKRDCCNDAVAEAQRNSARVCENAGGTPSPLRGGVQRRGTCTWESAVADDGVTVYRCTAEATVPCR
jgi:hypothetical protein